MMKTGKSKFIVMALVFAMVIGSIIPSTLDVSASAKASSGFYFYVKNSPNYKKYYRVKVRNFGKKKYRYKKMKVNKYQLKQIFKNGTSYTTTNNSRRFYDYWAPGVKYTAKSRGVVRYSYIRKYKKRVKIRGKRRRKVVYKKTTKNIYTPWINEVIYKPGTSSGWEWIPEDGVEEDNPESTPETPSQPVLKKAGNFSYKLIKPDEGDNLNVLSSISGTSTVCFKTEKNGTNIRIYFEEVYNKDCYEFAVRDATPKVFLEFCKRAAGISEEELMEGRKKIYKAEIGSDDCLEAFIPNRYVTDVKVYIKLKKGYKGGNARQFNKSDEGIFGYYTKDSYDKTANIQTFVLNGTDFWKKCLDRQLERWDRNGYFDGVKGNCPLKDKLRRIEDLAYDDNRTKFFSWETKGGHLYPYGNTIPFSKIRGIRLPDVQMCPLGDDDDYAHTAMAMMGIHYVDCQTQCFIKLMLKYLCGEDYDKYNIKIKGLSSHSIRVTYTENGEEKKYFFQLLHLYSGEEYDAILKERSNEDGDIYEFLTDDFIKGAHSQSGNYSEVYAERYWEHFKK